MSARLEKDSSPIRRCCILIVSSNAATGEFFRRELERWGYDVICVKPGMALESIPESSTVDIVVVDMFDDISTGEYLEIEFLKRRHFDLTIIAVGRKCALEDACVLVDGNLHYVRGLDGNAIVRMLRGITTR